jgi:hypothetical protein
MVMLLGYFLAEAVVRALTRSIRMGLTGTESDGKKVPTGLARDIRIQRCEPKGWFLAVEALTSTPPPTGKRTSTRENQNKVYPEAAATSTPKTRGGVEQPLR